MFREVYRVKDREDREFRFRPFVSRFLRSSLHSIVRNGRKTVTIINYGFVAGQRRLEPSEYHFRWGRNKPAPIPCWRNSAPSHDSVRRLGASKTKPLL